MKTKIFVISHWYNEELLAPLFLKHYAFADEIHILLDIDTNDNTREILSRQSNIVIDNAYCGGFDDAEKTKNLNRAISNVKEGWIYVVDADEFIFPENFEDVQTFLGRQTADVVKCINFHVYRHSTEKDIDYEKEVIPQRIHALNGGREFRNWFIKPSVFRASAGVVLTIGNHSYLGEYTCSTERYIGAHWKLADMEIAIRRRLSNKERMSFENKRKGYSNHEFHITKERIEQLLAKNSNLPILSFLVQNKEEI